MEYVIAIWLGAFVVVMGCIMIDAEIHHGPKWLQAWWKKHIRDDFPYSDDDWYAN